MSFIGIDVAKAQLEFAGRPVIMGNAIADLHGRGWVRTGTNDDAGVAQAVETFILRAAS